MNIEELKQRRQRLEREISEALNAFSKDTGLCPDRVDFTHWTDSTTMTDDRITMRVGSVRVVVYL